MTASLLFSQGQRYSSLLWSFGLHIQAGFLHVPTSLVICLSSFFLLSEVGTDSWPLGRKGMLIKHAECWGPYWTIGGTIDKASHQLMDDFLNGASNALV